MPPSAPLEQAIVDALLHVYDPEFGVSVVDLGLIYSVTATPEGDVTLSHTLTSFYCPAGEVITEGIREAVAAVPGVRHATVELVWEPLWTAERLSPGARDQLGWDGMPPEE